MMKGRWTRQGGARVAQQSITAAQLRWASAELFPPEAEEFWLMPEVGLVTGRKCWKRQAVDDLQPTGLDALAVVSWLINKTSTPKNHTIILGNVTSAISALPSSCIDALHELLIGVQIDLIASRI